MEGLVSPTIIGGGGEVEPVYTETVRAQTENDNVQHKSLCGETENEEIGEGEWRITIEGMVLKSQLQQLIDMRPAGQDMKVVTEGKTFNEVDFDTFIWEQEDEDNYAEFDDRIEPVFQFQLQTTDDDE